MTWVALTMCAWLHGVRLRSETTVVCGTTQQQQQRVLVSSTDSRHAREIQIFGTPLGHFRAPVVAARDASEFFPPRPVSIDHTASCTSAQQLHHSTRLRRIVMSATGDPQPAEAILATAVTVAATSANQSTSKLYDSNSPAMFKSAAIVSNLEERYRRIFGSF